MKINEIKLNEYDWMSIFKNVNDYGTASATRGPGQTARGKLTQDIFVRNFVNNAVSGLEGAIQSGLVNPNKSEVAVAQAGDFATPAPKMTAADVGDFDLKDKMAKQQADWAKAAKEKEIANVADTRLQRAAASPTSPEARAAVDARLQRAEQLRQQQAANKTTESKYRRLNALFEAIINEDGTESIQSYLTKFFNNHLRNVDISGKEQIVQQNAKAVSDAIQKSKGNTRAPEVIKALQNMGSLGYSLSIAKAPQMQPGTSGYYAAPAVAAPAAATSTQRVAEPKQAAEPAQQPAPAQNDNVSMALRAMGYSDADIKDRLSKVTATSDEEKIRQAIQMGQPQRAATTKTKTKRTRSKPVKTNNPAQIAGNVFDAMDSLRKLDPERWMEVARIMSGELRNDPAVAPQPPPDEVAARRASMRVQK